MSTYNALGRLRNNNSKQGRCFEGSFLTMFFANTPYSEVRESLKDQTLDDKQTFFEVYDSLLFESGPSRSEPPT